MLLMRIEDMNGSIDASLLDFEFKSVTESIIDFILQEVR
jgi:hypothetical protein